MRNDGAASPSGNMKTVTDLGQSDRLQNLQADLCVIGAGSGGLSVASAAAQLGVDVILIDGGP